MAQEQELKTVLQNDTESINLASELVEHNEQLNDAGNGHPSEFDGLPL